MIQETFSAVAYGLIKTANFLGISYNEANILVYFVIVPMVWAWMVDRAYRTHVLKASYATVVLATVLIGGNVSELCDTIFMVCVYFLCLFEPIGISYVQSSVIFCVIVPVVIHLCLMRFIKKKTASPIPPEITSSGQRD
jgi:hypothetical protein